MGGVISRLECVQLIRLKQYFTSNNSLFEERGVPAGSGRDIIPEVLPI